MSERYETRREIARGANGRIVVAFDLAMKREVALKEPIDESAADRLRTEIRALSRLSHPAIVPIYDTGERDGLPFLAMQLVAGRSLAEAIADAPTPEARLAHLPAVIAVAEALAYAHGAGVVHRDLEPANVLVGKHGETIVIDWGLAQLDGGDPAGDVHALGTLLYHLLAGAPPAKPPRPLAGVPADLVAIVDKALASKSSYPSAAELAADLERFQAGRLVAARRYSLGARTWRWMRGHRVHLAALALAVAVVVVAVTVTPNERSRAIAACRRAGEEAIATWPDEARARVLGATFAGAPELVATLDERAAAIERGTVAACEARLAERGEGGPAGLRARCYDGYARELRGLASALEAQPGSLARTLDAVERCDRIDQLARIQPFRDRHDDSSEVREELSAVRAAAELGRPWPRDAVIAKARASGDRVALADALWLAGGAPELRECARVADEARDDYRRARCLAALAVALRGSPEAAEVGERARAAVTRIGDAALARELDAAR